MHFKSQGPLPRVKVSLYNTQLKVAEERQLHTYCSPDSDICGESLKKSAQGNFAQILTHMIDALSEIMMNGREH